MGIAERKTRQRTEREARITAAARLVADAEGWPAVTIRRLAEEIEHSQPVLYSHFANREAIVGAVAVDGFRELATVLRHAAGTAVDRRGAVENVAVSYLAFAREHPALYEAMFTLPNGLRYADAETRPELKEAFAALVAVAGAGDGGGASPTEVFWASLHGLAELERSGRIKPEARGERVALVVRGVLGG
ncbi:MAG: TetR/AcrR family transcriptional regulator [Gluconacetobacter diazotrophicus]|nr:TetR/AcrR family transcriptional regulator [Gluconacetobacter diazotrophicus]